MKHIYTHLARISSGQARNYIEKNLSSEQVIIIIVNLNYKIQVELMLI